MKGFQKTLAMTLLASIIATGVLFGDSKPKESQPKDSVPKEAQSSTTQKVEAKETEKEMEGKDPLTEREAEAEEEAQDKEKEKENEAAEPTEKQVLGWKEWIKIGTKADVMRAKLDSGARTSSLHAENIEEFERDGREWVRFSMKDPGEDDAKSILVKAPVQRVARVKNTDGTIERRFVVELGFTVGERQFREEFNLNNRTGMTCPVLIGRNALRHLGYVDCSRVDLATKKIFK